MNYKLEDVYKERPKEDENPEEENLIPSMTVIDYFKNLFKLLQHKLLLNVPRDEKKCLDMTKWIWEGDQMAIPENYERAVQTYVSQGTEES